MDVNICKCARWQDWSGKAWSSSTQLSLNQDVTSKVLDASISPSLPPTGSSCGRQPCAQDDELIGEHGLLVGQLQAGRYANLVRQIAERLSLSVKEIINISLAFWYSLVSALILVLYYLPSSLGHWLKLRALRRTLSPAIRHARSRRAHTSYRPRVESLQTLFYP